MAAFRAGILVALKGNTAQISAEREMAQDDPGMIIHMYFRTAGAAQVFVARVRRTFKTEYISS